MIDLNISSAQLFYCYDVPDDTLLAGQQST